MAIIALSGKAQSGKDTVGKIIQTLTNFPTLTNEQVIGFLNKETYNNKFEIKKFADKLKEIVCILLGCTREQLEDEEFKSKELGEQWDKYVIKGLFDHRILSPHFVTEEEARQWEKSQDWYEDTGGYDSYLDLVKLTPRLLLQLLGTECGRNIIHPNIWVNSLMSEYTPRILPIIRQLREEDDTLGLHEAKQAYLEGKRPIKNVESEYPNWIITDMRFPNELEAIEKRDGLTIRVNRTPSWLWLKQVDYLVETQGVKEHSSETELDNAEFNYTIDNNGTLEELIDKVRVILTKEKFI